MNTPGHFKRSASLCGLLALFFGTVTSPKTFAQNLSDPVLADTYESAHFGDLQNSDAPIADEDVEVPVLNHCNSMTPVNAELLRDLYHQYQRVSVKDGANSRTTQNYFSIFNCARELYVTRGSDQTFAAAPAWSTEDMRSGTTPTLQLHDFLSRFQAWVSGTTPIRPADAALNFAPASNNQLELYFGHEPYHLALFQDLNAAQDSINMQMYGVLADDYGWFIAKLLAAKAKAGLKVRFMTDKFGARLTWLNQVPKDRGAGPIEPLLDYMTAAGVEVLVTEDGPTRGLYHYDHRKQYLIDGKIGWNVGYTIENAMRNENFDEGTRIQGDLVRQMQANFFTSWLAFGGQLPEAKTDYSSFMNRFFPAPSVTGTATVRLLDNIPRTQTPITESYYEHIANAKRQVIVSNLYFADVGFANALMQAKQNGADVTIIMQEKKSVLYTQFAEYYFRKFQKMGIHAYWFQGEENYGLAHVKVVLADDYASTGSCNFDLFSLYKNGEQNIETEDAAYVDAVRNRLFPEMLKYSTPYVRKRGFFRNLGVTLIGLLATSYEHIL